MRLTKHNGRKNKSGVYRVKHNDRNFDVDKAEHIDKTKSADNIYWHCYSDEKLTFEEAELKFYKENFSAMLEAKNARYLKQRHPERVRTMEEMIKNEKFCPEETLYYIGKKDDTVDKETLTAVFNEYMDWHKKEYPNIKFLDWAFHGDEKGAPHIHERHVWTATDKEGNLTIGQNKALSEMGIEAPEPKEKITKNNNAKITYTADTRQKLFEICKKHGLELIEEPQEASKSGLSHLEYIKRQEQEKISKLQAVTKEEEEKLFELKSESKEYATRVDLSRKDKAFFESLDNKIEIKKKTFSREEYVEMSAKAYRIMRSIAENGIKGNIANIALKEENRKLKNDILSKQQDNKGTLERLRNENKELKKEKVELKTENTALRSENINLRLSKKNEILYKNFIQDKGQEKDYKSWCDIMPTNVKNAEPDNLEKALKDWRNMNQVERDAEEAKAYLKEVHI